MSQRSTSDAKVEETQRVDRLITGHIESKRPRNRAQEPTDFSDYMMSRIAAFTYEQTEFPYKADQMIFAEFKRTHYDQAPRQNKQQVSIGASAESSSSTFGRATTDATAADEHSEEEKGDITSAMLRDVMHP